VRITRRHAAEVQPRPGAEKVGRSPRCQAHDVPDVQTDDGAKHARQPRGKRQSSEAGSAHRAVAGPARTSVPTSPYRQGRWRQRESARAVTSRDFPGIDTKKPETTGSEFARSNGINTCPDLSEPLDNPCFFTGAPYADQYGI